MQLPGQAEGACAAEGQAMIYRLVWGPFWIMAAAVYAVLGLPCWAIEKGLQRRGNRRSPRGAVAPCRATGDSAGFFLTRG